MTNFKALFALLLGLACSVCFGEDPKSPPRSIVAMKSGTVGFTVIEPDGVKPAANLELAVFEYPSMAPAAQVKTDEMGECKLEIKDGNFVLALGGILVTQLSVSPDSETSHLRLVIPENNDKAAALPPATDEALAAKSNLGVSGKKALYTALVITGAIATGVIIEDKNDDYKRPYSLEERRAVLIKLRPLADDRLLAAFLNIPESELVRFLKSSLEEQNVYLDGLLSSFEDRRTPRKPNPPRPKPPALSN